MTIKELNNLLELAIVDGYGEYGIVFDFVNEIKGVYLPDDAESEVYKLEKKVVLF